MAFELAPSEALECDYLVLGTGVEHLAFVDALLTDNRHATVIFADVGAVPGGPWCHAAPFSKLDCPNSLFGVGSWPLEVAHAARRDEILEYCWTVMQHLQQMNRVRYFPQTIFDGKVLLSVVDAEWVESVIVKKKVVDSLFSPKVLGVQKMPFHISADALVVSPSMLPVLSARHSKFVVIGSNRTAVESVIWLLQRGAVVENLQWIIDEDVWYVSHESMRPDRYAETARVFWRLFQQCKDISDFENQLESAGLRHRIDQSRRPTGFRASSLTFQEVSQLQRVASSIITRGKVRKVLVDRLVFEEGVLKTGAGVLHIDCTDGAETEVPHLAPIFENDLITLQFVQEIADNGPLHGSFSAALVGFVEAVEVTNSWKNALCTPMLPPRTVADALRNELGAMKAEFRRDNKEFANFLISGRPGRLGALSTSDLRKLIKERSVEADRQNVVACLELLVSDHAQPDKLGNAPDDESGDCHLKYEEAGCLPKDWSRETVSTAATFDFDELDMLEDKRRGCFELYSDVF